MGVTRSSIKPQADVRSRFRSSLAALFAGAGISLAVLCIPISASAEPPADPLKSVMWNSMASRFFSDGQIVFDQRVKVMVPAAAEDQFHVPVTVDASGLDDVREIVVVTDMNPIAHVLTFKPDQVKPFIGFRVKVEQSTPVRAGVKTADGVWHLGGAIVEAAGGGCTAPAAAHGNANWMRTLGMTRVLAVRESADVARLRFRMRHPMDTGLAAGIPVFHLSSVVVKNQNGKPVAEIQLSEPVSENPTFTLRPLVGEGVSEFRFDTRDTEGNEFDFTVTVPAHDQV